MRVSSFCVRRALKGNPLHGHKGRITGISAAHSALPAVSQSGAGGARTHNRRIMSPPQVVEVSSSSSSQVAYRDGLPRAGHRLPDDEGIRGRMHAERRQPSAANHRFRGSYHRASLTQSTRQAPSARGTPSMRLSAGPYRALRRRADYLLRHDPERDLCCVRSWRAVAGRLDAVAVLTARLLPAPRTGGPGWLGLWLPGGPASGNGRRARPVIESSWGMASSSAAVAASTSRTSCGGIQAASPGDRARPSARPRRRRAAGRYPHRAGTVQIAAGRARRQHVAVAPLLPASVLAAPSPPPGGHHVQSDV